jgi:hypothetical protein
MKIQKEFTVYSITHGFTYAKTGKKDQITLHVRIEDGKLWLWGKEDQSEQDEFIFKGSDPNLVAALAKCFARAAKLVEEIQ